jgi:hypothetical protein
LLAVRRALIKGYPDIPRLRHRPLTADPRRLAASEHACLELRRLDGQVGALSVQKLVDAGVLTQSQAGRRNRSFEAVEVLAALDDFAARARRPRYGTHSG